MGIIRSGVAYQITLVKSAIMVNWGMKRIIFLTALLSVPLTAQARTIDCYCTDSTGTRIELGESICLNVGGRAFTAQCQMSLNVPMWRETQSSCLTG